jgi:hypothetical protein
MPTPFIEQLLNNET